MREEQCPLCSTMAKVFYEDKHKKYECDYFRCTTCNSIFAQREKLPDIEQEKARYELHNDNVEDKDASRRVEFRVITNSEETINEIIDNYKE